MFLFSCDKNSIDTSDELVNIEENSTPKYDISILEEVEVQDGMLKFSEGEKGAYQARFLLQLSEEEYFTFINKIGFKSLGLKLKELYNKIDEITDFAEYTEFLNQNREFIHLEDNSIRPVNQHPAYHKFINEENFYMVGNSMSYLYQNKVIISEAGNKENLLNFTNLSESTDIKVVSIKDDIELRESCGGNNQRVKEYNGNRKVFLTLILENIVTGDFTDKIALTQAWGEKKNIWGNYKEYSTSLEFRNLEYRVINSFTQTVTRGPYAQISTGDQPGIELLDILTYAPCNYTNSLCDWQLHQIWAKGRSKSRGTNNNWAVLCCNNPPGTCPSATGE